MTILDWALGSLNNQSEGVKAELVILGSHVNPTHACFDDVTFGLSMYGKLATFLIPAIDVPAEEIVFDGEEYMSNDDKWIKALIEGTECPRLEPPWQEGVVMFPHQIMWATAFGHRTLVDTGYLDDAREILEDMFSETDDPDDIARLLIGCTMLDVTPPAGAESQIVTGDPISWHTYHKHLTADIYRALKD